MKLEVEMYVRTKRDGIGKIISLSIGEEDECCFIELSKRRTGIKEHNIVKASHNLIDLIEVGDYVNGLLVTRILEDNETKKKYINLYGSISEWEEEDIKSIVTKEMFANAEYRVETN